MRSVKLYTTSYCPYCRRAKMLLDKLKVPYEEIDVEGDDAKRDWLVEKTGQHTVPQIFVGDTPIGGFTDLQALVNGGEFDALLNASG